MPQVYLDGKLNIMRLGAGRLNYYKPYGLVTVAGTRRESNVYLNTLSVVDNLGSSPSTASFRCSGFTPVAGNDVKIGSGSTANLLFGGVIDTVTQVYEGRNLTNVAYDVTCTDYARLFNRRLVFGRYQGMFAEAIVRTIVTNFSSGFTANGVQSNTTFVADISFSGVPPLDALNRLAQMAGAKTYVDNNKDIFFASSYTVRDPATFTTANTEKGDGASYSHQTDIQQIRTRVYVTGGGTSTSSIAAPVGSTTILVEDLTPFSPTGGTIVTPDGQIITYTASGAVSPPAGQAVTLRTGGLRPIESITRSGSTATVTTVRAHGYSTNDLATISGCNQTEYNGTFSITFASSTTFTYTVTGTPATPATASSNTLSVTSINRSSSIATVITSTNHNLVTGQYVVIAGAVETQYNGTFQITVTSATSFLYTVSGSPSTPATGTITANFDSMLANVNIGGGPDVGVHRYAFSYSSSTGETAISSVTFVTVSAVTVPTAPTLTNLAVTGGIGTGAYTYVITYSTSAGETTAGATASATLGVITSPAAAGVIAATTAASGNLVPGGTYSYKNTYYTPTGETVLGSVSSASISTISQSGTISVAAASGSGNLSHGGNYSYQITYVSATGETTAFGTSGTISSALISPGSPTYTSETTGGSLTIGATYYWWVSYVTAHGETAVGAGVGHIMTASNTKVTIGIPVSGDNRVTARKVYRIPGNQYGIPNNAGFVATVNDNTSTSYTDSTADSSLGGAPIPTALLGNAESLKVSLTNLPTVADGRVTARKLYRTAVGGSQYLYVATLNTSDTSYTDNVADSSLGEAPPAADKASSGTISLSLLPSSVDARVIGQKIYRTLIGGSIYYLLASIGGNMASIVSITRSGGTATVTTSSAHYLSTNQGVTITGAVQTDYNVTAAVTVTGPTTFTYAVGGAPASPATGTILGSFYFVDNVPDANLSQLAPTVDTASTTQIQLVIPVSSDDRVIARSIYRTISGGSTPRFVGRVSDNITTKFTDSNSDTGLGADVTTVDSSGGQQVRMPLPVSTDTNITQRTIYRTASGLPSSQLKKLTVIPDNTATSAIDSKTDANLSGDSPLTVSTLNELTGIPATGPGSITVDLPKSYNIRLFVQRDDTVAQAALAAVEGGDGIHEYPIDDSTIPTVAAANARGDAELALFAYVDAKPTISTRDYKAAAGRLATISTSQISGSFRIQSVRISQIGMLTVGVTSTTAALSGKYHYPLRVVECSTARVTLQAILRSMVLSQSGPKTSS